jgi:hypothetical protein
VWQSGFLILHPHNDLIIDICIKDKKGFRQASLPAEVKIKKRKMGGAGLRAGDQK